MAAGFPPLPPIGDIRRPRRGFIPLFPLVDKDWKLVKRKVATSGIALHALARIETPMGFKPELKLRSARNFSAACARAIFLPRSKSGKSWAGWQRARGARSVWPCALRNGTAATGRYYQPDYGGLAPSGRVWGPARLLA